MAKSKSKNNTLKYATIGGVIIVVLIALWFVISNAAQPNIITPNCVGTNTCILAPSCKSGYVFNSSGIVPNCTQNNTGAITALPTISTTIPATSTACQGILCSATPTSNKSQEIQAIANEGSLSECSEGYCYTNACNLNLIVGAYQYNLSIQKCVYMLACPDGYKFSVYSQYCVKQSI